MDMVGCIFVKKKKNHFKRRNKVESEQGTQKQLERGEEEWKLCNYNQCIIRNILKDMKITIRFYQIKHKIGKGEMAQS